MLITCDKIRDFYYGVNEGITTPRSDAKTEDTVNQDESDKGAATEPEDFVQMSYSEFQ